MAFTWETPEFYAGESNFNEKMSEEIEPFLREHLGEGSLHTGDQTLIHYYQLIHPEEKAAIVISHGFCEFFGKYRELVYYFYQAGYSVFFIEHRGHGRSQRFVEEPDKVHVEKFMDYVKDLKCFVDKKVVPQSKSGCLYLYAHSMGGAIGTMFLETYPQVFRKAVLSSPMIEMQYGGIPLPVVRILMGLSKVLHWQTRFAPGQGGFDGKNYFETSCSLSPARYEYVLNLRKSDSQSRMNGGTYGWAGAGVHATGYILKNAAKVQIPVLMLQAGRDNMVSAEAQEKFAAQSKNTRIVKFENAKHEIFNCPDELYRFYTEIFRFLEEK